MTKDELIHQIAKLIAGLAVPRSLSGSVMLGAAKEPWDVLHRELVGFGWHGAEEYEEAIHKLLAKDSPERKPAQTPVA